MTNTMKKIMKKIFTFTTFVVLSYPITTFAAFGGIKTLLTDFGHLVGLAIPIAFGLALLFFFYGIARFMLVANDPKAKEQGRSMMIYGVIALFVISSVWGLVK